MWFRDIEEIFERRLTEADAFNNAMRKPGLSEEDKRVQTRVQTQACFSSFFAFTGRETSKMSGQDSP